MKRAIEVAVLLAFAGLVLACGSESRESGADPGATGDVAALELAAEAGDVAAQVDLGQRYEQGEGVPRDPGQAAQWYKQAALQGSPAAQLALGTLYFYGIGVPRDWEEAVVWVRKAADQGYPDAQFGLGYVYGAGRGVEKDPAKALELFRLAAEGGHRTAMYSVAMAYLDWGGGYSNEAEGVAWLKRAAENGHRMAQWRLGSAFAEGGLGLPQDSVEAYRWMLLSEATEPSQQALREQVELQLTDAERAEARRRADAWRGAHAQGTREDDAPEG